MDLFCHGFQLVAAAGYQCDFGTCFGKGQGTGFAQSASRPSDKGMVVIQLK